MPLALPLAVLLALGAVATAVAAANAAVPGPGVGPWVVDRPEAHGLDPGAVANSSSAMELIRERYGADSGGGEREEEGRGERRRGEAVCGVRCAVCCILIHV
jgi:hypothetical protein